MRILCTLASVAFIAAGLHAQRADNVRTRTLLHCQPAYIRPHHAVHPAIAQGAQRSALFYEDFANGLAGNNGFGAWSIMGTNGDVWRYAQSGPSGAFSAPSEIITSPTAGNGFMIFDSDSANTDFTQNPPTQVAQPVAFTGSLVSPLLNLSATPEVEIRFTETFRFCCGNTADHFLEVSTDGGGTWPTLINLNHGEAANTVWGTSETFINITSAISANPGNVRFRFTQADAEGNEAYYWEIDDVHLNTMPPNEMDMLYGYNSQFGGGFEYGRVPQSQLQSTINVGASIFNYGLYNQSNVVVNVSLMDEDNTVVASTTIHPGAIISGDTAVADTMMNIPTPLPTGIYTTHFTLNSDSISQDMFPYNNDKYRYFEVTDDLYSVDGINVVPDSILALNDVGTGTPFDPPETQDMRLLNYYEIHNTMTATGVQIEMSNRAHAGSYFIAMLYDTTSVLQVDPADLTQPLAESNSHVITNADIAAGTAEVAFLNPITLQPGAYFVSANLYQEGNHDLYVLDDITVPQPAIASMLWLPNEDQTHLYGGNGTAYAVRLSSDPNVSVQEQSGLDGVSVYPSPSTGLLHVRLTAAGNNTVEVFNVLGEVVKTAQFNGTSTTLDLTGNAAGVYSVRVGNGSSYSVQRITLQ